MRNSLLRRLAWLFLLCLTTVASNLAFAEILKPWKQGVTPPLALKDLQGHPRSLNEFRGKVVIVNFWATWCEPCVEEMPSLQKLKDLLPAGRVEVIGVNLGENEIRIRQFVEKTGIAFPLLLDRDGDAKKVWKVNGAPTTYVLDAKGRVRFYWVGEVDFADRALQDKIRKLITNK